jgi:hypothetical protein
LDIDQPVLERAKQRFPGAQVAWTHGDFLEASERVALGCMRERVRPGGTLALVAFARPG